MDFGGAAVIGILNFALVGGAAVYFSILLTKFTRRQLAGFRAAKTESLRVKYLLMIIAGVIAFLAALAVAGYIAYDFYHSLTCTGVCSL